VRARARASADAITRTAAQGDPVDQRMLKTGVADSLLAAERELAGQVTASYWNSRRASFGSSKVPK
jgi:hypothetical protein